MTVELVPPERRLTLDEKSVVAAVRAANDIAPGSHAGDILDRLITQGVIAREPGGPPYLTELGLALWIRW